MILYYQRIKTSQHKVCQKEIVKSQAYKVKVIELNFVEQLM